MPDHETNQFEGLPENGEATPEEGVRTDVPGEGAEVETADVYTHPLAEQEEKVEGEAVFETVMDEAPTEPVEVVEPAEEAPVEAESEALAGAEQLSEESAAPAAEPIAAEEKGMNWYIIHTYSGFENKVAESLKARAQAYHFEDRLGNVLIPTEEVVELRNGKKVTSKRLLYPGYVMVQINMDDEIWHHVKNTPRVTGFVGGGNTPVPLTQDEVNSILNRQATSAERPRPKLSFEKNETVRIVDGPFASFQGKVDEINPERNTLRVLVTIFGRATPVELEFLQVEKIT
jgi:transcription termination/antitermination protein NusG